MNPDPTPRNRKLHRYAQFVTVAVVFLLVAGAMVTSTGSGLAVPDWPLSFGQVMPPMKGGVFYEHGHRMVATAIGILTIILAFWIQRADPRPWMRKLGWTALGLVILQGLLGGMTVLLKLPVWTSAAHACLGQGFFLVVVFLALALSPAWDAEHAGPPPTGRFPVLAVLATSVIYIQLVLGAVMRHMNAGLVIPGFPLVFGGLVPPHFTPEIAINYAHRVWALVVLAAVLAASVSTLREAGSRSDLKRPARLMIGLVLLQILLGASIIWTRREVGVTTTHVVVGAVLLATSFVLTVRSWRVAASNTVTRPDPVDPRGPVPYGRATA